MKTQEITLQNGLRVILVDTNAFPTLTTLLLVGAGSRYENKENNGIAHFFEHMAFKGSKKYENSFVISSTIEGLGGVFNAFTSKDHTGYWIKSTNEHFETIIDVISDMVLHPLLLEEEINREKGVIVEEINMYEDTPSRKVGDYFEGMLYDGTPLGFDIAGTKKTVNSFTRKTFVDYISALYHPKNAVLIVAGGLSQKKNDQSKLNNYFEIIKEKFGAWNGSQIGTFKNIIENQTKPQIFVNYKKTEQAHLCIGFRAFSFLDKQKYVLSVLATILGGGMSSRLFMQVRERRGLCYYISTGRELYHDVGNIVTQAGVTNNIDKVKEAIETTLKEHKKMMLGDIKKDELLKAKELLKGRLLLSLEDSASVASFYGTKAILENEIMTPEQIITELEKVSIEEVIELSQKLFINKTLNFAIVGPFEKKEDFEAVMQI
ncbi:MAG: pitrilysin family protein [bacterium]|nr:pitrilysin family protein [bacterium]